MTFCRSVLALVGTYHKLVLIVCDDVLANKYVIIMRCSAPLVAAIVVFKTSLQELASEINLFPF